MEEMTCLKCGEKFKANNLLAFWCPDCCSRALSAADERGKELGVKR